MATNSKDIETLWQRYSEEGSKKGISVRDFFEKNGVPYHVFEKWYKRSPELISIYNIMRPLQGVYGGRFSGTGFKGGSYRPCGYSAQRGDRKDAYGAIPERISRIYGNVQGLLGSS